MSNNNSSDTSSGDESDHRPEDNSGVGRSYECAFCKRGFTNAQALGGHMNIHRKDKLKVAANNKKESSTMASRTFNYDHQQQQQQQQQYYYYNYNNNYSDTRAATGAEGHHMSHYQFNYSPPPNPSYQQVYHNPNEHHMMRYGDFMGANNNNNDLSLGVGPANAEEEEDEDDGEGRKEESDDEVDLELRLGHHKYR